MELKEVFEALKDIENGSALEKTIKDELAKANSEAAKFRTAKNTAEAKAAELESKAVELESKVGELTAKGAGSQTAAEKMQKQLDALTKKYEEAENARKTEQSKRIQSDILSKTVEALAKGNAANPREIAKIITNNVKVAEDGTYSFVGADGTEGSIDDGAAGWLKSNPWAVKNTQTPGSGAKGGAKPAGSHYSIEDLKSMTPDEINAHWDDIAKTKG